MHRAALEVHRVQPLRVKVHPQIFWVNSLGFANEKKKIHPDIHSQGIISKPRNQFLNPDSWQRI
jgi:hypothetical protein